MKTTITAALLIGLLGTGALAAHGNEKHEKVSQMMEKSNAEMPSGMPGKNMTPQMREAQMKKMQDSVIDIIQKEVKSDLDRSLSPKAVTEIRTQLDSLMKKMQKKMMNEGNNKLGKQKMKMQS